MARGYIAKLRVEDKIRSLKATLIQKYLKGRLDHKKVMAYKSYIQKLITIQRFVRKRLNKKNQCSILVQKYIKGYRTYQKYQRLSKVKQATLTILQ